MGAGAYSTVSFQLFEDDVERLVDLALANNHQELSADGKRNRIMTALGHLRTLRTAVNMNTHLIILSNPEVDQK